MDEKSKPSVKARPRWLSALGWNRPPRAWKSPACAHRLVEIFKHDSWAATSLYESPWGVSRVVKLHRQAPFFFVPMALVGPPNRTQ